MDQSTPRTPPQGRSSGPHTGATPRDAATVVVLRPGAGPCPEILMVRRSAQSPFMPSTFVFPGGRLDTNDGPPGTSAAFESAARRECHEETGLDLHDLPLRWFDTWITPSAEPRRYRARFYLGLLQRGQGGNARADGYETHDERWSTAEELIAAWDDDGLDLPPPTLAILLRLRGRSIPEITNLTSDDPSSPIVPKWIEHREKPWIVMPHDPEYGELPGEGHLAPSRVTDLPLRFQRVERRWLPWSG